MQTKEQQKQEEKQSAANQKSPEEIRQEQTDPNLTELKGFIDPDEKLEPEGTDNDV